MVVEQAVDYNRGGSWICDRWIDVSGWVLLIRIPCPIILRMGSEK